MKKYVSTKQVDAEITAQINKLLGFDECGFEYIEKDKEKRNE